MESEAYPRINDSWLRTISDKVTDQFPALSKYDTPIPYLDVLDTRIELSSPSFSFKKRRYTRKQKRVRKQTQRRLAVEKVDTKPQKKARFADEGILKRGEASRYSINGEDLFVVANTWIMGDLKMGQHVRTQGIYRNGKRYATSVKVIEKYTH